MKNFKENKYFMDLIQKNNDILAIKSALENFIVEYKGNKELCDEVIRYTINNTDFRWEEDDKRSVNRQFSTRKEEYYFEKERLVQNFTKERYEKVLILYKEYLKTRESKQKKIEKKSEKKQNKVLENKIKLYTFVATATSIVFFLYKLIKEKK